MIDRPTVLINFVERIEAKKSRRYMNDFGEKLINWYKINKRDLPWRNTRDPYKIWLSEIILQQTRVDQGINYYLKFIDAFPTVQDLAGADEDEILKLWQGLGYYSRARNLHKAAKDVLHLFDGIFPRTYEAIKSLKGIGDYTAAAIASFAYDLPYAVVDGNVYRVLSRYAGVKTPIDSTLGKKEFTLLANQLLGNHSPHNFNQAIMEMGALQCKPSNPDCGSCPLNGGCYAFENKQVEFFPVKSKKTKIRNRFFHYLVISDENEFYIRKRKEKDIWNGLHDFPMIESKEKVEESELMNGTEWKRQFDNQELTSISVSKEFKHILSHQHIYAKFYRIKTNLKCFKETQEHWKKVDDESVKEFAVPRLIEEYLKTM